MTDRDRLIELIDQAVKNSEFMYPADVDAHCIADHLLANGVIVQRKVKGYTDYFIDEYGNVYSLKTHKYLSQEKGKDGYYYVQLCENGKRKRASVHRLVAEAFIPKPDESKNTVNHIDYNKFNNRVDNLEWLSNRENVQDYFKKKGEREG